MSIMKLLYRLIVKYSPFALCRYFACHKIYNMGKYSYIGGGGEILNPEETVVGSYCSIAENVQIGVYQHPTHTFSTHPFVFLKTLYNKNIHGDFPVLKEKMISFEKLNKAVTIGNDVWIGRNVIVMNGVNIGDGAIIGAGAVVTKDVAPYAIVGGVPAKIIKYRFDKQIIDKLLDIKWWNYPEQFLRKLPYDDIETCIRLLKENKNLLEENCPRRNA